MRLSLNLRVLAAQSIPLVVMVRPTCSLADAPPNVCSRSCNSAFGRGKSTNWRTPTDQVTPFRTWHPSCVRPTHHGGSLRLAHLDIVGVKSLNCPVGNTCRRKASPCSSNGDCQARDVAWDSFVIADHSSVRRYNARPPHLCVPHGTRRRNSCSSTS